MERWLRLLAVTWLAACVDRSGQGPGPLDAGKDGQVGMEEGGLDAGLGMDAQAPQSLPEAAVHDANLADADDAGAAIALPPLLSQTGLFEDIQAGVLAPGVRPFEPRYKLWSDGASKRRWLYLPPGERIDTSDMDHWVFPVGTKAWKEFTSGDMRVETRLLSKVDKDTWLAVAYQWRADLTDADAVPLGTSNANGTEHDIPAATFCARCHGNMPDLLLGVSAIQLSHDLGGLNLQTLVEEGCVTSAPARSYMLPGDSLAQEALGYLHANCGHCHNPLSPVYASLKQRAPYTGGPRFWEIVGALGSVEETEGYVSTVGKPNSVLPQLSIIEPGKPEESELVVRVSQRGFGSLQMPPIATEMVDEVGMAAVKSWIGSMTPIPDDAGSQDASVPDAGPEDGAVLDGKVEADQ